MWDEKDNALVKVFTFPDFKQALAFVNKVGAAAEAMQHHPEITFTWGSVSILLTTHDAGGVTDKDHQLASAIDNL